jgi:hypothetical protein
MQQLIGGDGNKKAVKKNSAEGGACDILPHPRRGCDILSHRDYFT